MAEVSDEALRAAYVDEGLGMRPMAQRFDLGVTEIRVRLVDMGVEIRVPTSTDPVPPAPPREELVKAYVEDRISAVDLGERYDTSATAVYFWLGHYKIPLRGAGDISERFPEGIWRRVIEQDEVPYDRDFNGKVLTRTVDVLECGHRKPTNFLRGAARLSETKPYKAEKRRCATCEREVGLR